eukprot:3847019-Amphidinium_carterae.1
MATIPHSDNAVKELQAHLLRLTCRPTGKRASVSCRSGLELRHCVSKHQNIVHVGQMGDDDISESNLCNAITLPGASQIAKSEPEDLDEELWRVWSSLWYP